MPQSNACQYKYSSPSYMFLGRERFRQGQAGFAATHLGLPVNSAARLNFGNPRWPLVLELHCWAIIS